MNMWRRKWKTIDKAIIIDNGSLCEESGQQLKIMKTEDRRQWRNMEKWAMKISGGMKSNNMYENRARIWKLKEISMSDRRNRPMEKYMNKHENERKAENETMKTKTKMKMEEDQCVNMKTIWKKRWKYERNNEDIRQWAWRYMSKGMWIISIMYIIWNEEYGTGGMNMGKR